jgi:hypothetical protein
MDRDFEEAVHALYRKMAEETDPKKLKQLKQQLRRLFLDSEPELEKAKKKGKAKDQERD